MNFYETWNENRTHVLPGKYKLKCVETKKLDFWLEGKKGYGKAKRILLMFEVIEGQYSGAIIPMFLTTSSDQKVSQGSNYYKFWAIANGMRKPIRGRLREMPMSMFIGKPFLAEVVDVKPYWIVNEQQVEQPELFWYSRVKLIYELLI